jgi:hypothetical protein
MVQFKVLLLFGLKKAKKITKNLSEGSLSWGRPICNVTFFNLM